MNVGNCFSQAWVEAERERLIGWFGWGSDAARPRPEQSIALLPFFAALLHEAEEGRLFVRREVVFGDVACFAGAVVVAISLDEPSSTHFHFVGFVEERPIVGKLLAVSFLPIFSCFANEILILCCVSNQVAVAVFAFAFLLRIIWVPLGFLFIVPTSLCVELGRDVDFLEARWKDHVERSV